MLVTKDWAYIHFPKTGGTWVGQALHKACQVEGVDHLYSPIHVERWRAAVVYPGRNIPILGCVRNPLDWYVSKYEYWHWTQHQRPNSPMGNDPKKLGRVSFSEWLSYAVRGEDWSEMLHSEGARTYQGISWEPDQGWMTIYLWYWFSMAPWQLDLTPNIVPHKWGEAPTTVESLRLAFQGVHFFRMEQLANELDFWLAGHGFGGAAREAVRTHPRVNVTARRGQRHWRSYYSDKDEEMVRQRERLIFEIYPEY